MGSGCWLQKAQRKYGIKNFIKEILYIFDNPEQMFQMEALIVNEDFIESNQTYNLKLGGAGGWGFANKKLQIINPAHFLELNKLRHQKHIAKLNSDAEYKEKFGSAVSKGLKESYKGGRKSPFSDPEVPAKIGRIAGNSPESLKKKKQTFREIRHQQGPRNSQYGTRWIHSQEEKLAKKIKKEDPLPAGWSEGRKIKTF